MASSVGGPTTVPRPSERPCLLREWSHDKGLSFGCGPEVPRTPPSLPPPVTRSQTPVAVAVTDAVADAHPVVATLVTNIVRGFDHIYAGIAERVEDGQGHQNHGAAGQRCPARRPGGFSPPDENTKPFGSRGFGPDALSALDPPSTGFSSSGLNRMESFHNHYDPSTLSLVPPFPPPPSANEQEEEDWVMNAYDEAEFHVVGGRLIEVRVPVPSVEEESDYDDMMVRGRGCGRRKLRPPGGPQLFGSRLLRRRDFNDGGEGGSEKACPEGSPNDALKNIEEGTEGGPRRPGVVGRVAKWAQRRRERRQQKRRRKGSEDCLEDDAATVASEESALSTKVGVPAPKPAPGKPAASVPKAKAEDPGRPKAKSTKSPRNADKRRARGNKNRNRGRPCTVSNYDEEYPGTEDEDGCLRLRPLPNDPRPRSCQNLARERYPTPSHITAPAAQFMRRTCHAKSVPALAVKGGAQAAQLMGGAAVAIAAASAASVQAVAVPEGSILPALAEATTAAITKASAATVKVPPSSAFGRLPPIPGSFFCGGLPDAIKVEDDDTDEDEAVPTRGDSLEPEVAALASSGPPSSIIHEQNEAPEFDNLLEEIAKALEEDDDLDDLEGLDGLGDAVPSMDETDSGSSTDEPMSSSEDDDLEASIHEILSFSQSWTEEEEEEEEEEEPKAKMKKEAERGPEVNNGNCMSQLPPLLAAPSPLVSNRSRAWTAPPLGQCCACPGQGITTIPVPTPTQSAKNYSKPSDGIVCLPCKDVASGHFRSMPVGCYTCNSADDDEGEYKDDSPLLKVLLIGEATAARSQLAQHLADSRQPEDKHEIWDPLLESGGHNLALVDQVCQSVFFPKDALYILAWDMAVDNAKTFRPSRNPNYNGQMDAFLEETTNKAADRALQLDIEERVITWVGAVQRCAMEAPEGSSPVIFPVAVPSDHLDTEDTRRRCEELRRSLLRLSERGRKDGTPIPEFLFAGQGGTVPVFDRSVEGKELLNGAVNCSAIAVMRRRANEASSHGRLLQITRSVLSDLKKDHKLMRVEHIISLVVAAVDDLKVFPRDIKENVRKIIMFLSSVGDLMYFSMDVGNCDSDLLSQFVVLDCRWLLSAMSCVVRPDLKQELVDSLWFTDIQDDESIDQHDNCLPCSLISAGSRSPIVTSSQISGLWRSMEFVRNVTKAAPLRKTPSSPPLLLVDISGFLKAIFVKFGVLIRVAPEVPLGHADYENQSRSIDVLGSNLGAEQEEMHSLYFLPSLAREAAPPEIWTFKARESWSTTLCHSWLFKGAVPHRLMDRVVARILQDLLGSSNDQCGGHAMTRIHQLMVWKDAFLMKMGTDTICPQSGELTESIMELYGSLVGPDSSMCVAAASVGKSMKRLIISGKGQVGSLGRKIWDGGFASAVNSTQEALQEECKLYQAREIVCPDCLSTSHPNGASSWRSESIEAFALRGNTSVRCDHAHDVNVGLLLGHQASSAQKVVPHLNYQDVLLPCRPSKAVNSLLGAVVLVGLWDSKLKQIRNIGSGFVADKDKGLIITASHILFDMQATEGFGAKFYGLKDAKAVIGVIPRSSNEGDMCSIESDAVFRYFAEIVAHDVEHVDACVLRITTKFENDVGGDGEGCGDQPEIPLVHNPKAMKAEKLQTLKMTKKYEREENVRILGYNQGGEGLLMPGMHVNRTADFAAGYICKKFKVTTDDIRNSQLSEHARGFNALEEIVVMCPTINGHSGGPCVNNDGAVVGILSRADPAENQRCYLVPVTELKRLMKMAKAKSKMNPLELYYRQNA